MKCILALALAAPAAAFVAPSAQTAGSKLAGAQEAYDELVELQNSIPGPPGFYDPLGLAQMDFAIGVSNDRDTRGVGQEATIGFLRHAEIKHGRVAMAAFLGYIAQCQPIISGEHKFLPYKGYVAGVTPQEQWDNIPLIGKLQIFTLIGMLESYGEGAGNPEGYVHYMAGGKPGFYPEIKGKGGPGGHFLFNLWDPFGLPGGPKGQTAEQKARGLKVELLNGRAAMFGILGILAQSSTPGSVPFLNAFPDFPKYSGEVMAPFAHDFTLNLGA